MPSLDKTEAIPLEPVTVPGYLLPDEVAARVAGFFAARAGQPVIPDAPRVRLVLRQQLETALPRVLRALELPPPNNRRDTDFMNILETDRLVLQELSIDDAQFILELLNEPSFLRFIGDKGVRTVPDACRYILTGPVASYERNGFGLYRVALKEGGVPIGMCGLLKRPSLQDVDLGFAFLPRFWSVGYALEAASAVLAHGRETLGLKRIVAITSPDNSASIRVLEKLGFGFEGLIRLSAGEDEVRLFASQP